MIDGQVLPAHPFDPAASALSDGIPLMIGGTKYRVRDLPGARRRRVEPHLSEEELRKRIAAVAGDATDGLLAYYKRRDPPTRRRPIC